MKWFRKRKREYEKTKDINVLINKTGQRISNNSNKKPGLKKKKKINSSFLDKDDIDWMLSEYYEIIKNDLKYKNKLEHLKKKIYRIKKPVRHWDRASILSKSTIYRNTKIIKREKPIKFDDVFKQKDIIDKHIIYFFTKHKRRIGRRPISIYIKKEFNMDISDRQTGRRMNRMALFCKVRIVKRFYKQKEKIHKFIDLVHRDYDNLNYSENIVATDITYLNATNDIRHNHIYIYLQQFVIKQKEYYILNYLIKMI